jgi:hypothetical protein
MIKNRLAKIMNNDTNLSWSVQISLSFDLEK